MAQTRHVAREVHVAGAVVGVYEYGAPDGRAVFVFHGTPACGAGFAWADEAARTRGLRLLAPDRPGVGRSTPKSGYAVGEYPAMVAALADTLAIDRFAVWGYSGGGPYAMVCAATLGDRVTAAAIAAGMGQVGAWATFADFEKTDREMLGLAQRHPAIARVMLGFAGRAARWSPKIALKSFEKQLSPSDRAVMTQLGDPRDAMVLFTNAFERGARGVVDDYIALAKPWNVDLAQTRAPVWIFHGDADSMVPLAHSQALATRVPNARLVVWPGEGHLGTISHAGDILDVLT
jgi:pimeloyl-ACP methyl ester carboxylesterase